MPYISSKVKHQDQIDMFFRMKDIKKPGENIYNKIK
jgi:hypothetical protein